jgi:hypothetical protein
MELRRNRFIENKPQGANLALDYLFIRFKRGVARRNQGSAAGGSWSMKRHYIGLFCDSHPLLLRWLKVIKID